MKIDAELVKHIANLAHLELTSDEVTYYETQLSKVLGYVAMLDQMPTDSLEEGWRDDTHRAAMPERQDAEAPSLDPELALAAAPQRTGTAFQVPRIID